MISSPPNAIADLPLRFVTLEERPDLKDAVIALDTEVWPTFMTHTAIHQRFLPRIAEGNLARFQVLALLNPGTSDECLVGTVRSIPLMEVDANDLQMSLPSAILIASIRHSIVVAETQRNIEDWGTLTAINCVLSVAVASAFRDGGLGKGLLRQLKDISRSAGFSTLVAPVRPTQRGLYPSHRFDDYCNLRNAAQQPLDPWIRAHTELGATPIQSASHVLSLSATLDEWQAWTGMTFPESGHYWIPGGLSPLKVDVEQRFGAYREPRLWMAHALTDVPLKLPEHVVRTETYRCTTTGYPDKPWPYLRFPPRI